MKKKSLSKFIAILLFVTMVTLIALAGTYAKYTSTFEGTGSAQAANWNVTVNGQAPGATAFTFTATEKIYPGATNVSLGNITVANSSSIVKAQVKAISCVVSDASLQEKITLSTSNSDTVIDAGSSATIPVTASWNYTQDNETSYSEQEITFTITLQVDQVTSNS